jgi:hypothetical protein
MVQRRLALLVAHSEARNAQRLKHGTTVDSSWTMFDEESGLMVGNTQLVIHGASPLDIIAYLMDVNGRHRQAQANPEVEIRLEVREVRNVHCTIVFSEFQTPPFRNRTFLQALVWKRLSDTQYVWCASPVADHPSVAPSDESHAVRAEGTRVLRFTLVGDNVTSVEYACTLDLKGSFPAWLTTKIALPTLMHLPLTLQQYFLQIRPIGDCTADDGRLLGLLLLDYTRNVKKPRRAKAVATFTLRTAMLREVPLANLVVLLQSICKESYDGLAGDVKTRDPAQLTAAHAKTIGDGITAIRRGHTVPAKAVAEALAKYAVLRATAQQCTWFEPMLVAILVRQMAGLTVQTGDNKGGGKFRRALASARQRFLAGVCRPGDRPVHPEATPAPMGNAQGSQDPTFEAEVSRPNYVPLKLQLPAR